MKCVYLKLSCYEFDFSPMAQTVEDAWGPFKGQRRIKHDSAIGMLMIKLTRGTNSSKWNSKIVRK